MRIAVLAGYAPSLINFRGPLLTALRDAGHEVVAMAPPHDGRTAGALSELGIRFVPVPLRRTGIDPVQDLKSIAAIRRILIEEKVDAFFGYTVKPVVYGLIAAKLAGVQRRSVMVTGLGHAFIEGSGHSLVSKIVQNLYRVSLRFADRVIFHNADDRQLFYDRGLVPRDGRAVVVDGSGVDTEHFKPLSEPTTSPVRFLLIGRLLAEKGINEYVEAARRLKETHPTAECHLVGGVDSNPSGIGIEQVRAWESEGIIKYTDHVDDVRPAIDACTVYVLPSYREGMPRTVLEAMAMGRPVLVTNVAGCRETVVDGYNGYSVSVRSAGSLASGMRRAISDAEELSEMGRRSREMAVERFDVARINERMLEALGASGDRQ